MNVMYITYMHAYILKYAYHSCILYEHYLHVHNIIRILSYIDILYIDIHVIDIHVTYMLTFVAHIICILLHIDTYVSYYIKT